jgi:hypothetical protein
MPNKKIYVPCVMEFEEEYLDEFNGWEDLEDIREALNSKDGLVFYADRPIRSYLVLRAKQPAEE